MNPSHPGQREGAHRTHRSFVAALVPSLIAVVAVTALIVAINVWRGSSSGDDGALDTATTTAASPSATPTAGASGSASPSRSAASTPPASSSAPASSTSSTSAPPQSGSTRAVQVVVLNQSGRGGLAGQVADRLRSRGWTVAGTGDFRGTVPATTVYYPPGAQASAQAAAEALAGTPRIRPRFGNLSPSRLTVVVTSSYPG